MNCKQRPKSVGFRKCGLSGADWVALGVICLLSFALVFFGLVYGG